MPLYEKGVQAISASDATFTGTVVLSGGANITVGTDANNVITISGGAGGAGGGSFSAGVSTGGNTSGDTKTVSDRVVFAGGNNITLSQSTNAGSATITISAFNQTGTQFSAGISGGNTSGDTGTVAGRVVLAGGNKITLSGSTNGVSETITISAADQTVQTQNRFNLTLSGNTAGTMAEVSSGTLSLAGGAGIILSQSDTNKISIVNSWSTATTVSSVTSANAVGANAGRFALEAHQHAGVGPAGVSNVGNTSGDTGALQGRLVLAGGNNITLSQSTSNNNAMTVTISAFNQTSSAYSAGMSTGGNTSGDTGYASARLNLAGGNNITLSGSTNGGSMTITISGGAGAGGFAGAGISNIGNTSGDTGSVTGRLILAGTPSITLSGSTNAGSMTVTISAPQTTSLSASTNITLSVTDSTIKFSVADPPKIHVWRNFERQDGGVVTHLSAISKTPFYFEEVIPGRVTLNSVIIQLSNVTNNTLQSFDVHLGVYTFVNSTSAALLGSASDNFNVSSASSVSFTGMRHWVLTSPSTHTGISNLTPGNYLFGMMFSAGASQSINQSLWGVSGTATTAQPLGRILPGNNQLSTATSQGALPMFGQGSATVNALPANIVASDIRNQGTATVAIRPWLVIRS